MGSIARRSATYQDVLDAPADKIAQIVNGELVLHPRPAGRHTQAASILGMDIGGPYSRGRGGPGGWWILDEPELHLGEAILVPDLAGWRVQRLPAITDDPFFSLAPDWICEVLSPSTRALDRIRKLPIYGQQEVGHAWLVDPESETLEVFCNDNKRWVLIASFEGNDAVRAEPFDEITLQLGDLWRPLEEGRGRS